MSEVGYLPKVGAESSQYFPDTTSGSSTVPSRLNGWTVTGQLVITVLSLFTASLTNSPVDILLTVYGTIRLINSSKWEEANDSLTPLTSGLLMEVGGLRDLAPEQIVGTQRYSV